MILHVEFGEAGSAEGVPAVDHDARQMDNSIVVLLAELAVILIEQL